MRHLRFSANASSYRVLYQALISPQVQLATGDLSQHVSLMRKFEAIGVDLNAGREAPDPSSLAVKFYITPEGGDVELEENEYSQLQRRLDAAVPFFPPQVSDQLLAAKEWLAASPKLSALELVKAQESK